MALLALTAYLAPRRVRYGGRVRIIVWPTGSLAEGCTLDTSVAKLLFIAPIRKWRRSWPTISLRLCIDDLKMTVAGSKSHILNIVPPAASDLKFELERVGCILASKSAVLASSPGLGRDIKSSSKPRASTGAARR